MLRSVWAEANFGACFGVWPGGGPSRPGAVSAAGTIAEVVMSARPDVSRGAAETLAAPSSAGPVATIAAGSRTASVVAVSGVRALAHRCTNNPQPPTPPADIPANPLT